MDSKELANALAEYSKWNRGRCAPWWSEDLDNPMNRYSFLTKEDIEALTEAVAACTPEELAAAAGSTGMTVFHLLVWCGLYGGVEKALEKGIDVNLAAGGGCEGVTPLMAACYRGNEKMAGLLLEKGADPALLDKKGRNVFHYLGGLRINSDLINSHASQEYSLDQRTALAGRLSGDINAKDQEGMTPFEVLIKDDNSDFSYALSKPYIEKGADIHIVDEEGDSLLMRAVKKRHFAAALALMEADMELVNQPDKEGTTPLHLVSRYNIEFCIAILDKKGDKNAPDGNGKTPKDMALESGDSNYKQLFTSGRLKLNELSRLTSNAFAGAGEQKDRLAMGLYLAGKLIREVDTDDDEEMGMIVSILYNAISSDDKCRLLEMLVKAGIDLTAPIHSGGLVECIRDKCLTGNCGVKAIKKFMELGLDMDQAVVKGRTPAFIVASQQERNMMGRGKDDYFEEAAKLFSRESMEQTNDGGTTAVHEAARRDHVDMLRVMIEKGVDLNLAQDQPAEAGNTPLHEACAKGNAKVVELLMKSGADDTIQNVKGETAAYLALTKRVFGGDMRIEDRTAILEALEHVDIPGSGGRTPLMQMLRQLGLNDKTELLPMLLDKGVDLEQRDDAGNTALLTATDSQSYKGIVKELVRAGADVNAENKKGDTALHLALKWGDQESSIFLIKKGADYNHANNAGVTPAQLAAEKGYDTVLELMTDIQ